MRSGFVTLVGRPNVGKSTLLNAVLGQKVSITSDKPQTTRTQVRGVLTRPDAQLVFVDTPGLHKPKNAFGERMNDAARDALPDVEVICFLVEANATIGKGDRYIAEQLPAASTILVLNKIDLATPEQVMEHLKVASEFGFDQYFPVSAKTGEGVVELVDHLIERMPEGPQWYPDDMVTDVPEAFWVAELVREQLLSRTREELPHAIAVRVTEWEWPYIRCEILVQRDSQKGIVIGHKGSILKEVGMACLLYTSRCV